MSLRHPGLWWGPPRNFNDRKNERKISWLELFYDLVYVAVIGELTQYLSKDPSWSNAAFSFLLFCLIFWSWVNGSQYYDLHGNEGIRTRLLTFWQMLAVAAVAITIPDAYEGRHEDFAVAFLFVQVMITYIWWSVGLYDPSHRVFNKFYTINYVLAFVVIFISIFVSSRDATWLLLLALLLNLTPPLTGARKIVSELKKRGQIFTASAAIVERFGSFTIIVLAESILATVTGIAAVQGKHSVHWIAFILAILISFLLWSIYFDMTSEQETKTGYNYMCWFSFSAFPPACLFKFCGRLPEAASGRSANRISSRNKMDFLHIDCDHIVRNCGHNKKYEGGRRRPCLHQTGYKAIDCRGSHHPNDSILCRKHEYSRFFGINCLFLICSGANWREKLGTV